MFNTKNKCFHIWIVLAFYFYLKLLYKQTHNFNRNATNHVRTFVIPYIIWGSYESFCQRKHVWQGIRTHSLRLGGTSFAGTGICSGSDICPLLTWSRARRCSGRRWLNSSLSTNWMAKKTERRHSFREQKHWGKIVWQLCCIIIWGHLTIEKVTFSWPISSNCNRKETQNEDMVRYVHSHLHETSL